MIKGIICDLDGAYFVHGKKNFVKNVSEKYKVGEADVRTMFFSTDVMQDYKRGKISDDEYWQKFIQKLKIDATKEGLINLLIDGYEQAERIVNLVKSLKEKEFETIVCSNNFPARIKGLDERFHFLASFTVTVFSYKVGSLKLEGFDMYEEVIKKSGLNKDEILIFDNGPANIAHAKAYGFVTILYHDYLQLMGELEKFEVKV